MEIMNSHLKMQVHLTPTIADDTKGRITRSGNRNQQVVKSGRLMALNKNFLSSLNPTGGNDEPLSPQFVWWNEYIAGGESPLENNELYFNGDYSEITDTVSEEEEYYLPNFYYCDPSGGVENEILKIDMSSNLNKINFTLDSNSCTGTLTFDDDPSNNWDSPSDWEFYFWSDCG